ncbi:MAG: pimeloyl-ACP methyl ester esterase BioH [Gammaproteobacteria bacterium]|nr:pimeloyl-ACP methyl ester esterase BioH [Gammaproteobacteria bacterium]
MTLYYEQHGRGPDVVLVHGWGLHGGIWSDVARELSARYRVTVPDLPGHGRSRDFQPQEFTPEGLAGEVQRVLPGPAVWIGWSMGGFVTLAAAQRAPQTVTKLVLVGATPKYVQSPDWPHAMSPTVLDQFALNLEQDYVATLERFLSLQMAAGEDRSVLRRLRDEMFRHGHPPAEALHEGLRLLKQEDRRAALPGIAVPTLVVHGERDRITPVGAARFLAAQMPQAQLELVPAAGHAPFLSHDAYFLDKLKSFLHG